jgi:UDP-N-acetylmuramoyl-L-alanyl-D-glutamate--2,6-diaminopimelate ligase
MHLGALLAAAGLGGGAVVGGLEGTDDDPDLVDIAISSAEVKAGSLFACVPGLHVDGHDFAAAAADRGALALLCERPVELRVPLPQVLVPSVRRALGPVSAAFWGQPSRAMKVVGVTGTNGKTTTCALLASIFEAGGERAGVMGTLTGERTTPEAPTLQRRLAELRRQGTVAVAMEVSSHALDQHRVDGTAFAAAVFTNLSQDHLDYHGTMESYFAAKAALFRPGWVPLAVVNQGDEWGARLARQLAEGGAARLVTYSPDDATEVTVGAASSSFSWRGQRIELNMGGRFNVTNAVAAATTAVSLGAPMEAVRAGLATASPVRGRMELVEPGVPIKVLVDFAHTPAALAAVLGAAREMAAAPRGRVIVVFGAGGDRDRGKRPAMGAVARRLADVAVVTTDNPRSEDPLAIIDEVVGGAQELGTTHGGAGKLLVVPDRAEAISRAVGLAEAGDVVVVAGKGHEMGQDFGDKVEPFDDALVARQALGQLGWAYGQAKGDR